LKQSVRQLPREATTKESALLEAAPREPVLAEEAPEAARDRLE